MKAHGKESARDGYRPDIDGLRAVAVTVVVLFHLGLGCPGGYVGVDVFFVISGFLITRLIVNAQEKGDFNLREFWVRRIRRLFPAMFAMQLSVLTAGLLFLLPHELKELAEASVAQVLFYANFHFASELDYFAGPAELQPLLHTWSLAVEEQFYLFLPLALVVFRSRPRVDLLRILGLLTLASFCVGVWVTSNWPSVGFFWLPFRAWELMAGSILACVPPATQSNHGDHRNNLLSLLGMVGIGCGVVFFDSQTPFPGLAAVLPCVSTVLVLFAAADETTFVSRALSCRPMVAVGLISYSLYLFHWPVIVFLKIENGPSLTVGLKLLALVTSFLLGYMSWRFVESPFRARRVLPSARTLVGTAIASVAVAVCLARFLSAADGLPNRFDPTVQRILSATTFDKSYATRSVERIRSDDLEPLGRSESGPIDLLVWGDSHAMAIAPLCDQLATEFGICGRVASRSGIVPLLGAWRPGKREVTEWNQEILEFVRRRKVRHVVLVSRWAIHAEKRVGGLDDCLIKDHLSVEHSRPDSRRVLDAAFRRTVEALQAEGAHVWVMKQVPLQSSNPVRTLITSGRQPGSHPPRGVSRREHAARQGHVNKIIDALGTSVSVVDLSRGCFDHNERSLIGSRNACFYVDEHHLSIAGAEQLLGPLLKPMFAEIAAERLTVASSNPESAH